MVKSNKKKVVIVCTSASELQGKQKQGQSHATGLWIEELAAPYYIFLDAGYEVVIASPRGGPIPIDAASMAEGHFTARSRQFLHDPAAVDALSHSVNIGAGGKALDWWQDVNCIYLPGGHGTCVDFVHNQCLRAAVECVYGADRIVAAVCHGPIGLCDCVQSDGTPLVAGKTVTGFADSEEDAVQLSSLVPFLLEARLRELGGKYEKGENWQSKVCVDGNLVTGQNPQSSEEAAKMVVSMLSA